MRRIVYAAAGLMLILFASSVAAQTADELVKKAIEAQGGRKNILAIKTLKMTGKVLAQQGVEFPFTIYEKRPMKMRMESTIQGQTMVQAYDGEKAWWIMPFMGSTEPQLVPEEQAKDIKEQADFDGPLFDYKKKGNKVEYLGKEEVEGTDAYKLKVTLKNGSIRYVYLDAEYYLPIKVVTKRKRKDTEITVETYQGDYKKVAGVLMPHSIESRMNGKTVSQITIEKVEPNIPLDDSLFVMPKKTEKGGK